MRRRADPSLFRAQEALASGGCLRRLADRLRTGRGPRHRPHDGSWIRPPEDWRTLTDEEQKDWVRALFAEALAEE